MSRKVNITGEIQASIRHAISDPDFDTSLVSVFEGRFITTEPVRKRGLWDGARISGSTLAEMAQFMSEEGNAIPLHIMHETGLLPVGKVFYAETFDMANGETELRGHFYVPNTEVDYISKIETAIVDEVSIGLTTSKLLCSECEFDYLGAEADIMNILNCTCANDHTVGENGVHVRGVGMANWNELSLVGTGAANKAKILGKSKQRLAPEVVDRLAANKNWGLGMFQGSYKLTQGETEMTTDFPALFAAEVQKSAVANVELKAANDKVVATEATLATANKTIETLQAENAELKKDDAKKTLAEVQATLTKATEMVAVHAKAALVASGTPDADVPADLVAMLSMIDEKGLKLHQAVGAGTGTSKQKNDVDKLEAAVDTRNFGFKTRK